MKTKPLKLRRCKQCSEKFQPIRPLQGVCSWSCSIAYQKKLSEKLKQNKWRDERKKMIEKLKTHKDYLQDLQTIFNTFIRFRDANKGCISCGINLDRKFDAGHFYSIGHYPALRFNEDNVHGQCVQCNQWMHGNLIMYAEKLPKRIGQEHFDILTKSRGNILKFSIPELKELIKTYKLKLKLK